MRKGEAHSSPFYRFRTPSKLPKFVLAFVLQTLGEEFSGVVVVTVVIFLEHRPVLGPLASCLLPLASMQRSCVRFPARFLTFTGFLGGAEQNFDGVVGRDSGALVLFTAPDCGHCKVLPPAASHPALEGALSLWSGVSIFLLRLLLSQYD